MAVLKPKARINYPRIKPKIFKGILKDPTYNIIILSVWHPIKNLGGIAKKLENISKEKINRNRHRNNPGNRISR